MQNNKAALLISLLLICLSGINGCGRVKIISSPARISPFPPDIQKQKSTQRAYKIKGKTYYPIPDAQGFNQRGLASWYGPPFHGRKTSNGETYNMYAKTAAHKTMPMGTYVLVQNLENCRETVVRINDRGPFVRGRIIDLSKKAAKNIGMLEKGTARVEITALGETVTVKKGQQEIRHFLPYPDFQKGKFYIQLGSFHYKENSLKLKKKLLARGMAPVIVPFHHGGQLFYRLQILVGGTLKSAEKSREKLAADFPGAFVIRKD